MIFFALKSVDLFDVRFQGRNLTQLTSQKENALENCKYDFLTVLNSFQLFVATVLNVIFAFPLHKKPWKLKKLDNAWHFDDTVGWYKGSVPPLTNTTDSANAIDKKTV